MSTTKLDNSAMKELQAAHGLWQFYQPEQSPLRFQATNHAEALEWQHQTRQALRKTLGFDDLPSASLNPQKLEAVDKGDYIREKWLLRTWRDALMPVYILVPKTGKKPFPTVLALHGHGYGVKDIVGLWETGEERDTPDGYHKDFGIALVRRGFLVAAPEIACFGERRTDFTPVRTEIGQIIPDTCHHAALLAFHLGGSVLGLRVHDGMRLVDYLETRPDADLKKLGAMGISGGGMHTLFSTCLDERIRACVISGYYATFQDSIFAMAHCPCNYVPGLAKFGEMYDLIGLIAPRPVLVEAGNYDPIFPIQAVEKSVRIAQQRVYSLFGAPEEFETDYFEGRHSISGRKAYDFLWKKLA